MELVDFITAKKLLEEYKILSPRTIFVASEKDASVAAKKTKYPVFLKAYGKKILHRTEKMGVKEVASKAEFIKTFSQLKKINGADGVLIQEKAFGKNLILGMKRDAQFGPVIIAGIGGIFAEIIKDFTIRVAPISESEALKMLADLKGYAYLRGARDKKAINLKAVAKIIVALSDLSLHEQSIKEIDLNPVIADGKKALAVDFKFLI